MECKHKLLRTVGDRVFCQECGEELPLEALTGKPKKAKPADTPTANENPPENPPAVVEADKTTTKKTTAKKAAKKG